jgi:hypothetical protein
MMRFDLIFDFCSALELARLESVCREFRREINCKRYWKFIRGEEGDYEVVENWRFGVKEMFVPFDGLRTSRLAATCTEKINVVLRLITRDYGPWVICQRCRNYVLVNYRKSTNCKWHSMDLGHDRKWKCCRRNAGSLGCMNSHIHFSKSHQAM